MKVSLMIPDFIIKKSRLKLVKDEIWDQHLNLRDKLNAPKNGDL